MSASYVAFLGCLLSLAPPVHAQEGVGGTFGLPMNIQPGGWARYVLDGEAGPRTLVIRCAGPGKHQGKAGQWLAMEVELPDALKLTLRMLVAGKVASPENVLTYEVKDPDGKVIPVDEDKDGGKDGQGTPPPPKPLPDAVMQLGGKPLPYKQYLFPEGVRVGWSPKVPGLGFVYVTGGTRYALVATGVGGDPWKGAERTAFWPENVPPASP